MPRIDPGKVSQRKGSIYPRPFATAAGERIRQSPGRTGGLVDFGVNFTHLPPGTWSSQRHWDSQEEEFVYVLSGELALITDADEEILRAGDCAAFPKNVPEGHRIINRSNEIAVLLEMGTCHDDTDVTTYPGVDLLADAQGHSHRDGVPYSK